MQSHDISLVGLPRELLDNIASFLPTRDFNALRSTSKLMEDKIFPYWANCFFKKRQFMIDPLSLKTLVDISQHESLSKVMVHLVISLDDFRAVDGRLLHNDEEYNQWRSAAYAQHTLLVTGVAVTLLSTALPNLPNLRIVDIRDFDSPTRYRDAVEQQPCRWRSYGHSKHEQWKHALCHSNRTGQFCGNVFQAVLAALDRCSPALESLEVILKQRNIALSDDAFAFSPVLGAGLTQTLHSLTVLHLDVVGQMTVGVNPHLVSNVKPTTTYLRGFLRLTANVTWLRLNFEGKYSSVSSEAANSFFGWLGLDPNSAPPGETKWNEFNPAPVALPLRRLDIGHTSIRINVLRKTLAKFSDLENISIKQTVLEVAANQSSAQGSFDNEGTDEDSDSIWTKFIRGLSRSNPKLKQLMLSGLSQVGRRGIDTIIFYDGYSADYKISMSLTNVDYAKLEQLAKETWTLSHFEKSQRAQRAREGQGNEGELYFEDEDVDQSENEDEDEDMDDDEGEIVDHFDDSDDESSGGI